MEDASSPTATIEPESVPKSDAATQSVLEQASEVAGQATSAVADTSSSLAETFKRKTGLDTDVPEPQPSTSVYVGNLFFDVREQDLERQFSGAGKVVKARVISDQRGLSKG